MVSYSVKHWSRGDNQEFTNKLKATFLSIQDEGEKRKKSENVNEQK